jgi:hypothetical protein
MIGSWTVDEQLTEQVAVTSCVEPLIEVAFQYPPEGHEKLG